MADIVKYVNSKGGEVVFTAFPILCNTKQFREFLFMQKNGKLYNYSEAQDFKIEIVMSAKAQAKNNIFRALEYDAINNSFGRLYFNDSFLICSFQGIETIKKEKNDCVRMDLKFFAKSMDWLTEHRYELRSEGAETTGIDYPNGFPFDYSSSIKAITSIVNNSEEEADIIMEFTEPSSDISVTIGGHEYNVDANIAQGEKLVIDTLNKRVYKGDENLFRFTDDNSYIFKRIPSGESTVSWEEINGFVCRVIERRRFPEWI